MKELQKYLNMTEEKLTKEKKMWRMLIWLMFLAFLMMTGIFLYFYFHNQPMTELFLFVIVCVVAGSLHSKQMLRYIEMAEELKKLKIEVDGSS